jgi:hypothetical protein
MCECDYAIASKSFSKALVMATQCTVSTLLLS